MAILRASGTCRVRVTMAWTSRPSWRTSSSSPWERTWRAWATGTGPTPGISQTSPGSVAPAQQRGHVDPDASDRLVGVSEPLAVGEPDQRVEAVGVLGLVLAGTAGVVEGLLAERFQRVEQLGDLGGGPREGAVGLHPSGPGAQMAIPMGAPLGLVRVGRRDEHALGVGAQPAHPLVGGAA